MIEDIKDLSLTKNEINNLLFNLLVEYVTYQEFGSTDVLLKKDNLTVKQKAKLKVVLEKINDFNKHQLTRKNEKSL